MKKINILLFILISVVSTASAALTLDVEVYGEDYIGQCFGHLTEITVKIIQDQPNPDGSGGIITVDFIGIPGTISGLGTESVGDGWDWMIVGTQAFIGNQAYYEVVAKAGKGTPGVGSLVGLSAEPIEPYSVPYEQTLTFSFFITEYQTIRIGGIWDGELGDYSEMFVCIPEPMSVALLGLGGLFLRRRRA